MSVTVNESCEQQVKSGEVVTLECCAELLKEPNSIISWTQLDGGKIELDNKDSVSPSFTAPTVPIASNYIFELSVTQGSTVTHVKHTVTVKPETPPIKHPKLVLDLIYDSVLISNTKTTMKVTTNNEKDIRLTYNWYQTEGTNVILVVDGSGAVYFTTPQEVTEDLTFEVTVSDGLAVPSIGVFKFKCGK